MVSSCSCVLFAMTFFFELDELTFLRDFALLSILAKVLPQLFCRFFRGFFFWPSGESSSFGLVGAPCWVFPVVSPWFSGGLGVRFALSFLLFSCILHLASPL